MLLDTKTHTLSEQLDASYNDTTFSPKELNENNDALEPLSEDASSAVQVGDMINNTLVNSPCHMVEMEGFYTPGNGSSPKSFACENHLKQNLPVDKHSHDLLLDEKDAKIPIVEKTSSAEITEDELMNRISVLEQERLNLGDEQKRLERNAESVNSEMFAECQVCGLFHDICGKIIMMIILIIVLLGLNLLMNLQDASSTLYFVGRGEKSNNLIWSICSGEKV